jgi:hypothetical protein
MVHSRNHLFALDNDRERNVKRRVRDDLIPQELRESRPQAWRYPGVEDPWVFGEVR